LRPIAHVLARMLFLYMCGASQQGWRPFVLYCIATVFFSFAFAFLFLCGRESRHASSSMGLSSCVKWHRIGGRVHVPSNGRDIYICSGTGQAFQCGGKYSEGKKHKMCHVCMRDGLLFFFASALAFQILRGGYLPVANSMQRFPRLRDVYFLLPSAGGG